MNSWKLHNRKKSLLKNNVVLVIGIVIALCVITVTIYISIEKKYNKDILSFQNANMELAVLKDLDTLMVSKDRAASQMKLDIKNAGSIEDLEDLSSFCNLTELYIQDTNLDSLEGIQNLKNLKKLVLSDCNLRDATSIYSADLKNLEYLDLTGTTIDLTALNISQYKKMSILILDDCNINGYIDLGLNDTLTLLSLNDNQITGIAGNLPHLEKLYVNNNQLENLTSLIEFKSLTELKINGNPIKELTGILKLENLELLGIMHTQVTDVRMLKELPNFNSIYLSKNFDREKIAFIVDHFKSGDRYTKQYVLNKRYHLGE